jgi:hypothetical protein
MLNPNKVEPEQRKYTKEAFEKCAKILRAEPEDLVIITVKPAIAGIVKSGLTRIVYLQRGCEISNNTSLLLQQSEVQLMMKLLKALYQNYLYAKNMNEVDKGTNVRRLQYQAGSPNSSAIKMIYLLNPVFVSIHTIINWNNFQRNPRRVRLTSQGIRLVEEIIKYNKEQENVRGTESQDTEVSGE